MRQTSFWPEHTFSSLEEQRGRLRQPWDKVIAAIVLHEGTSVTYFKTLSDVVHEVRPGHFVPTFTPQILAEQAAMEDPLRAMMTGIANIQGKSVYSKNHGGYVEVGLVQVVDPTIFRESEESSMSGFDW